MQSVNETQSGVQNRGKAATSAVLRTVVACYIAYLGVKIVQNEDGSMQQTTARLIGGGFILAAIAFGIYILIRLRQDLQTARAVSSETEKTQVSDVLQADADVEAPATLLTLYENYFLAVEEAERNCKPTDGLFGMGQKAADAPCHGYFEEDLTAWVKDFAEQNPSSEAVCGVMRYMYTVPQEHQDSKVAYWMLLAVQGTTIELVPYLNVQDAKKIRDFYADTYPRAQRLPMQKTLYEAIEKRASD